MHTLSLHNRQRISGMLFQHQVVRDLAWCCSSAPLLADLPSLVNTPGQQISLWPTEAMLDTGWLAELDRNPHALLTELAQLKSTRLGIYYETLWRFYWQHHPRYRLLAHNLQVTEQGQTLGAFDFIVQEDDTLWHIETAVKFYLGVPVHPAGEWAHWIGPNCNDRLDIKMARLLDHQLPLRFSDASQAVLRALTPHDPHWRSALCLQGYFFYPAHHTLSAPHNAHPHHQRGRWWYLKDFLREEATHYWMILPRHLWLSAAQTDDIHALIARDSLRAYLSHWVGDKHRPQLIAAMTKDNGIWKETLRGFVVPDHWPWTDTPSRNT